MNRRIVGTAALAALALAVPAATAQAATGTITDPVDPGSKFDIAAVTTEYDPAAGDLYVQVDFHDYIAYAINGDIRVALGTRSGAADACHQNAVTGDPLLSAKFRGARNGDWDATGSGTVKVRGFSTSYKATLDVLNGKTVTYFVRGVAPLKGRALMCAGGIRSSVGRDEVSDFQFTGQSAAFIGS